MTERTGSKSMRLMAPRLNLPTAAVPARRASSARREVKLYSRLKGIIVIAFVCAVVRYAGADTLSFVGKAWHQAPVVSKVMRTSLSMDEPDPFSAAGAVVKSSLPQGRLRRADERKLRSAIEGITRDQEELRLETPLLNAKTYMKTASAVFLALVATGSVGLGVWSVGVLPALTSMLFIYSSAAESSGQRSKSVARYNSAQAVNFAATQEAVLAEADIRKAFLPFGVGLTAIFAAACVSLKLFLERLTERVDEGNLVLTENSYYALDVIVVIACLVAIIGAVETNIAFVGMRAALLLRDEDKTDEDNEWESGRLPKVPRDTEDWENNLTVFVSVFLCILPIPFVLKEFNFETFGEGLAYTRKMAFVVNRECIVVSAIAGAQAAFAFLVAEKEFSDAERRISKQMKQAALSELFYAQTLAETVVMPARSAWSGFALAAAVVAVEFSTLAAAIWPWPAVLSAFRSLLGAKLAAVEADAAYLERKISKKGDGTGRKSDVVSSSIRELSRNFEEVLKQDGFPEKVRENLLSLPLGAKRDFTMLNSESRRQVHAVAAELGMISQSILGEKTVSVINYSDPSRDGESNQALPLKIASNAFNDVNSVVRGIIARGIPESGVVVFVPALLSTFTSVGSTRLLEDTYADLLVPVATGGVALATVYQERLGKNCVAEAKKSVAVLEQKVSDAESAMGLAGLAMSALPTYLAIATSATAVGVIGMVAPVPHIINTMCTPPLAALCGWMCLLSIERQKRITRYAEAATKVVDAPSPPLAMIRSPGWWLVPIALGVLLPLEFPRRMVVIAAALAAEVGLIFADAGNQVAAASFYVARAARVFSRADAWTQEAGTECRALPLNSAIAIINTLLATALIAFDTPLNVFFPIVGLLVCVQALQSGSEAQSDSSTAGQECESIQELGTDAPPFLARAAAMESQERKKVPAALVDVGTSEASRLVQKASKDILARLKSEGRTVDEMFDAFTLGTGEIQWQDFKTMMTQMIPQMSIYESERLWQAFDRNDDGGISRKEFKAVLVTNERKSSSVNIVKAFKSLGPNLVGSFDEAGPEVSYEQTPAEKAVQSVQNDIAEVNVSVRRREEDFFSTAGTVGVLCVTGVIAPFVLSEIATEVCLPVVGAILTIFAVYQESDARRTVAASKVWAAELNEIAATQEELLTMSNLYKSRLLAVTGLSVAIGVITAAIEETFEICEHYPSLIFVQDFMQAGLIAFQIVITAYAVRRFLRVRSWTTRVIQTASASLEKTGGTEDPSPMKFFRGEHDPNRGGFGVTALSILPPLILAFVPFGRHFAKRAVASTAAGAAVIGLVLFFAEMALARAERAQSARARTFALADAFSNSAEQQGAILPLASAATIAGAALVTFVTELNPFIASGITVIQVIAWIVASRKSLTCKFQSQAALQVNLVSVSPPENIDPSKEPILRRLRRGVVKWLSSSQVQQLNYYRG